MPIPPRPIPVSSRSRPGSSVPRKCLPSSQLHHFDWRAEVTLLSDLSQSAPSNPSSGVRVIGQASALREKAEMERDRGEAARREVGVAGMIVEGKGRVKRATTATTLGFDFVASPVVVALPDESKPKPKPKPASLLTASKGVERTAPPSLSDTPKTPTLLPVQTTEDDDDGWEHVPFSPHLEAELLRDEEEMSEDGDVIVLGELELEDERQALELKTDAEKGERTAKTKGLSYAAALGAGKA